MKRVYAVLGLILSLFAPAHAGVWVRGSNAIPLPVQNYNVLWSAQSLWNSMPVNPVLGGTQVPYYPISGAFGFNAPFPGSCETVAIGNPGTPATIDMSFITDEAQARNFSVTNFPTSVPNPAGTCNDVLWDYIDTSTQNLMSFIQFAYSSGTTYTGLNFESYPIAGTGMPSPSRPTGVRAAGSPAFSGYIRLWEQNNSIFNHALSFSVDQTMLQGANSQLGPKYPMTGTDGGYSAYTGNNFHIGSLLMLPSNFPVASMTSAGGAAVARTLMTYGGYIVDTTGTGSGGFNLALEANVTLDVCGFSSNPCTDLGTILSALREVMTEDSWKDANSNTFTPPSWTATGQNILSMRGTPWQASGGGTLPSYGGFYNTIVPDYEFPNTSVTPGTTFTVQAGGYYRNYTASGSWAAWASGNAFYTNPVAGRQYTLAATGTGTGVTGVLEVLSNNNATIVFTSSSLAAGQSQTFTWPAVTAPGSILLSLTKTAGPAATINFTLVPTGPQAYYISNSGSNSNNGMSSAAAWQTIAHANSYTGFVPGDIIYLDNCSTFTDELIPPTAGYLSYPIIYDFNSWGNCTQATIAPSAANTPGIALTNLPFVEFHNPVVTGQSATTDLANGIVLTNSQSGNTKLEGVVLLNPTVSNFGYSPIAVVGSNGSSGFNRLVIHNPILHDSGGASQTKTAGISISSATDYGSGISSPAHNNITIDHPTIYNISGAGSLGAWSGAGVYVAQSANTVVQYGVIHNNGSSGFGSCGVLVQDGTANKVQYNEIYAQGSTGAGGCGVDIDGGNTNTWSYGNYTHGNFGPGQQRLSYNDGTVTTWSGNYTAFNISENDGTGFATNALNAGGLSTQVGSGSTMTGAYDFNNTIYNAVSSSAVNVVGVPTFSFSLDNIFYTASSTKLLTANSALTNSQLLFNYNDYFTTGSFSITWNGTTYSSFSAWQTASSQEITPGGGNVGLTSNPNLVNPGGGGTVGGYNPPSPTAYQLNTGSPMLGAGIYPQQFQYAGSVGGTAYIISPPYFNDFYGNYANAGSYNVGAY